MKAVTKPNSSPPRLGTTNARSGSSVTRPDNRSPRIETKEKLVHEPHCFAHGGDRKAGDDADDHGDHDDARLTRANYCAQSMRHFEWAV